MILTCDYVRKEIVKKHCRTPLAYAYEVVVFSKMNKSLRIINCAADVTASGRELQKDTLPRTIK